MSDGNVGASIIVLINVVIQKMFKGKKYIQITLQIKSRENYFGIMNLVIKCLDIFIIQEGRTPT